MRADLIATGSQTIGPFFHFALTGNAALGCMCAEGVLGERIRLVVRLLDADAKPAGESMIELWQADASGKYRHPEDAQEKTPDPAFRGFGRMANNADGVCEFQTIKPGRVPGPGGGLQAPHINVTIFGRGLLQHLWTRIYFEGDPANADDAVLRLIPENRRGTLMARPDGGVWRIDIRISGEHETVFFDI